MSTSAEQHVAAGRLDEPQHARGRASSCRSRIRRRARASRPAKMSSDTPSTALARLRSPTSRRSRSGPSGRAMVRPAWIVHRPRARNGTANDGRASARRTAETSRGRSPRRASQRGANGQPGRQMRDVGRQAGNLVELLSAPRTWDRAPTRAAPSCTDCRAARTARRSARCSKTLPAYITTTSSVMPATTPRSCVIENDARAGLVLELLDQLENLRLNRDVERGRRLVGDEQLRLARQRHRNHHALAHAAGELVRIAVGALRAHRECRPSRAC